VTVGHVVASIGESVFSVEKAPAATSTEASDSPPPAAPKESDVDQSETQRPKNVLLGSINEAPARHALIRFPARRTPNGEMISMLPAAEAAAAAMAATETTGQSETTIPRGQPMKPMKSEPRFYVRLPLRPTGPPPPPRRELTDREIETVMLGGICD
jgi:hypothetical protein